MASQDSPSSAALIPDAPILTAQYKVLDVLGEGGMGRVYRGEHRITGQVVAIKSLRQELISDNAFRLRFVTEAKALSRLDHPFITHLYNFIEESDGRLFLVMQFVKGQNLEDVILGGGALPETVAVAIMHPILRAFSFAHQQGVVHRDIKPANIVLTPDSGVKVMDFGIARIDSNSRITATGASLGSPGYMSPEQVLGRPLDHRCDIYSLGVMLYEMVVGDLPFPGDNGYTVMNAHVTHPVPDPRALAKVSDPLAEAIMWAMQKDPDRRPQRVDELAAALPTVEQLGSTEQDAWHYLFGQERSAATPRILPGPSQVLPVMQSVSHLLNSSTSIFNDNDRNLASSSTRNFPPQARPSLVMDSGEAVAKLNPQPASPLTPPVAQPAPVTAQAPRQGSSVFAAVLVAVVLIVGGATWLFLSRPPDPKTQPEPVSAGPLPPTLVFRSSELVLIPAAGISAPFYMDRTEITWRQYRAFVQACPVGSGCGPEKEPATLNLPPETLPMVLEHPVASISHADAAAYCRWAEKRLPTSEEWNRAGSGTDNRAFPWGNEAAASRAWLGIPRQMGEERFFKELQARPGQLPTVSVHSEEYYADDSPYGVLGMGGNVSEWLADASPEDKTQFQVAGGSWNSQNAALESRVTERLLRAQEETSASLGFRCALDAKAAIQLGKPDKLSQVLASKVLRVGAEAESPPMIMNNDKGELEGFEYELMQSVASSIGVKLEVVFGQYTDLPSLLKSNRMDMLIAAYTPDDSIRGLQWSQPYLEYGLCMIVRKNSPIRLLNDLTGKKVGHYSDPATSKAVRALVPPTAKVIEYENRYMEDVRAGQMDAFLYDFPLAVSELKGMEESLHIVQFGLTESTYNAGIMDGEYSLMRATNRAIARLRSSDAYSQLLKKYLGGAPAANDIPPGSRTTLVQQGDTLQLVAQRELKDGKRWPEIWALNKHRLGNQNLLYPGTLLVLPQS